MVFVGLDKCAHRMGVVEMDVGYCQLVGVARADSVSDLGVFVV